METIAHDFPNSATGFHGRFPKVNDTGCHWSDNPGVFDHCPFIDDLTSEKHYDLPVCNVEIARGYICISVYNSMYTYT